MASGLVVHIEVGKDRHTEVLSLDRIRIGSSEDSDLRLHPSLLPVSDAPVVELTRANGNYRIGDFNRSLAITHNGAPLVYGTVINDGDELRVEPTGLAIQFFPVHELPAVVATRTSSKVAPFIESAAIEAAATARRDDAKVFLREFTRELVREINTSTKVITLLIAGSLVGGVLYLGFAGYREFKRIRHLNDEQRTQLSGYELQLKELIDRLTKVSKTNENIIGSLSVAPKVYGAYSNGVFLIFGKYQFVEAGTNRPLRYPELQVTEEGGTLQTGDEQQMTLTPDGRGPVAEFPYFGTGFYVGNGFVITNRHIAFEPWVADQTMQTLSSTVAGQPRIVSLQAYFPGSRQPIALRLKQTSKVDDLAVCTLDVSELPANTPALPLDVDSDASGVGKTVVLMGYPTGYDRILANLPEAEAQAIRNRYGASFDVLIRHLAERNLIKPLTTQGHITELTGRRIVYDATTAEGGSGAPLFGSSGRVIGVNFQLFALIPNANHAVPIRYAVALLRRAGWKLAQETPDETNANGNVSASKDARNVSPPAAVTPAR
ncbi:MAG TPA: trypsin-like peptidase domain-containing protein [Pyrinomonadaceae bacterium]|nr:trypsin-like peptidase domain-containing protein [Pyrinomonadaceae bacterium]